MTPYQITIDWEHDFILESMESRKIEELFERARFFKEHGCPIYVELKTLRELRSIKRQIRAQRDLNNW